jgi:PAS domain S-box-containing protein
VLTPTDRENRTAVSWAGLFWTSFKRSHNAMALLDEERRCVEVNGAYLRTLGYRRAAVVGKHAWDFVVGGPAYTEREWRAAISRGDFFGKAEVVTADGARLSIQYAAHPEKMTGRRLILFVVLDSARHGRFRRHKISRRGNGLSRREREVVQLIALGRTGREIADELHIAHDTVRTHVRNAQEKLGARSRAQLVAIALGEGHTAPVS